MDEQANTAANERKVAKSLDSIRPLRRVAATSCLAAVLAVVLLLIERELRLVHLYGSLFLLLLLISFSAAGGVLALGGWLFWRGGNRIATAAWVLVGVFPIYCWGFLGWYGQRQWKARNVPNNLAMAIVRYSGISLMEVEVRFAYSRRLETDRLVMFFGDSVTAPEADLAAMDEHVARMEAETGVVHRDKIWWVRGRLLGQGGLAVGGLALGSENSPIGHADLHELAHAVMYQANTPATDPPMLLVEGWAEAQSSDRRQLAVNAEFSRSYFAEKGVWWDEIEREQKQETVPDPEGMQRIFHTIRRQGTVDSYLRMLTDPFWHQHDAGTVYHIGGPFVDFLLRRYGTKPFVELYYTTRVGTFAADCQRIYGVDLDTLESEFWADVERLAREPVPEGTPAAR